MQAAHRHWQPKAGCQWHPKSGLPDIESYWFLSPKASATQPALDPSSGIRHAAMDALLIRRTGPEIPADVCEEAMTRLLDSGDPEVILWSLKRHSLYIGEKARMKRMPELARHPNPLVAQHAKEILERGW